MKRLFIITYIFVASGAFAQNPLTMDTAIAMAVRVHPQLMVAQKELEEQVALKKGSFNLPDPQFMLEAPTGDYFTPGIQQSFDNPLVYVQQSKVRKEQVALAESGITVNKSEVIWQVSKAYIHLQYAEIMLRQYFIQDSIFKALDIAANKRYVAGDVGLLEKTSANVQATKAALLLEQSSQELINAKRQLAMLVGKDVSGFLVTELARLPDVEGLKLAPASSPLVDYAKQNTVVANRQLKLARTAIAPGFSVGFMNQGYQSSPIPQRFQFGLSIPLWFWTHSSRVKAAKAHVEKADYESELLNQQINTAWLNAVTAYQKHLTSLQYYENTGLKQSQTIYDAATQTYTAGEIGYIEYLFALNQAFEIKTSHYEEVRNYNKSLIELNYLNGKKL